MIVDKKMGRGERLNEILLIQSATWQNRMLSRMSSQLFPRMLFSHQVCYILGFSLLTFSFALSIYVVFCPLPPPPPAPP